MPAIPLIHSYSTINFPLYPYTKICEVNENRPVKSLLDIVKERYIRDLNINLADQKVYHLNGRLTEIYNEIIDSQELLKYQTGWDDENALPTDFPTFSKAINFLVDYSNYICDFFLYKLQTPFINLMGDGSVYIQWNDERAAFTIIFKKSERRLSYYFREEKETQLTTKGAIINDKPLDTYLASWFKDFLALPL